MTSLNDGPVRAISAPGRKPLIVLTGAAHLMVRGAHACVCGAGVTPRHPDPGRPCQGRSSARGEHATKTRGTLGARIVLQSAINPRKEDSRPSQSGNRGGGGYEIRTREGVNPTRFPSERHRPLGESSVGHPSRITQADANRAPHDRSHSLRGQISPRSIIAIRVPSLVCKAALLRRAMMSDKFVSEGRWVVGTDGSLRAEKAVMWAAKHASERVTPCPAADSPCDS